MKLLGAKSDGSNNIIANPWMMLLLCCVYYYSVAVGHISLLSFPEAWLRYQNALFINPNTTLYAYGCVQCFLSHQHGFTQERLHTCRYQNALFLTQITTLSIILPHISYHKFCKMILFYNSFTRFYEIISHAEILYWISHTLKHYQLQWVKFSFTHFNQSIW